MITVAKCEKQNEWHVNQAKTAATAATATATAAIKLQLATFLDAGLLVLLVLLDVDEPTLLELVLEFKPWAKLAKPTAAPPLSALVVKTE